MQPIYHKNGHIAGWLEKDEVLDPAGKPCAFLEGDALFNFAGTYLGVLEKGFFRDRTGDAVAYVPGATGGPMLPISDMQPLPPLPLVAPPRPFTESPPIPPLGTIRWSVLPWPIFLSGQVVRPSE